MTPKPLLISRTLFRALFSLSLTIGTLFAQSTGGITGRVYDQASGRSLQGAVVTARGTAISDYTDAQGRYTLSGVPAGAATVDIEYVGLDPLSQSVTVTAGEAATLDAAMKSTVLQLEAFTVQETARGQALAINQQKTAEGIVNIISEEIFGAMNDSNIGQALQRLPGLSVNEDHDGSQGDINIRGIAGEFNSVQIDGNRAPTSGGSRSFNPRQLAADGVSNIEVIKAPTPDRDGDAIGGIINLVTRSAFERDGRSMKLKAAGVWNQDPDKWGHAVSFSYSDLFGIGGKPKNLGVSFTVSSHKTDRYHIISDQDWVQVTPEFNPELNLGQYDVPVWFFEANHWEYDTRVTKTHSFQGSIDFRIDEQNSFYLRPLYTHFDRNGITFETDIDIDTRFQDQIGGRKTYAQLTPNYGRGTPGNNGSRGSIGWIGTDDDNKNDLYGFSLGGRHERGGSLLEYDFFHSRSKNVAGRDLELNMVMEPDDPWFLYEYEIHSPVSFVDIRQLNPNQVSPTDLSNMSEGEMIDETSWKTERVYSARVDWSKKLTELLSLKTGLKYRVSMPRFDRTANVYDMDEDFPYASVLERTNMRLFGKDKYWDVYPQRGKELLRTNPGLFELNEEDTLEDSNLADYDAEESTSAAYIMGTLRSGRHTVIAGIRFEKNEWESVNKRASYLDGNTTINTVNNGNSFKHWLPGIHFRHELARNLILRESYNKSYGRPRLSQLTRGRFTNEDGDIQEGNPGLTPAKSDNFDIQLEYYTANGGLYSAGFFYKKVKNFSFDAVYEFDELDANGVPIRVASGDFEYEKPENGSTGKNWGWELIARQRLTFLPGPLKGFSAALSATFTESEATIPNRIDRDDLTLPGFSPYLFTATLEYARGNFRARADYRYRDDYIEGLGDDIESDEYFAGEERVDGEISYRLRKGLSIYANVTNFTKRPQVSYQGFPQFVEDAAFAGRKWTFGVEYSF